MASGLRRKRIHPSGWNARQTETPQMFRQIAQALSVRSRCSSHLGTCGGDWLRTTHETHFRHNQRNGRLPSMNLSQERLTDTKLAALRRALNGAVVGADHPDYDSARRVWNGQIDRRPAAIVRATSIADVMGTVRFCRENGIKASVRGGGHSAAGKALADGALLIDLSPMREVQVDSGRKRAVAQGGATWSNFDRACESFKLATTGGVISSTGVCGLTLGGGMGWLMGKHGLSCDNVISADMANADGGHCPGTGP